MQVLAAIKKTNIKIENAHIKVLEYGKLTIIRNCVTSHGKVRMLLCSWYTQILLSSFINCNQCYSIMLSNGK